MSRLETGTFTNNCTTLTQAYKPCVTAKHLRPALASGAPFNLLEQELAEWKERERRGWDGGVTVVGKCIKWMICKRERESKRAREGDFKGSQRNVISQIIRGTRTSTRGCKDGWSNVVLIHGKQKGQPETTLSYLIDLIWGRVSIVIHTRVRGQHISERALPVLIFLYFCNTACGNLMI